MRKEYLATSETFADIVLKHIFSVKCFDNNTNTGKIKLQIHNSKNSWVALADILSG